MQDIIASFNLQKKGFIISHLALILFFAVVYYIIHINFENTFECKNKKQNNKELSFFDFIYFSLVTQTTVGYGDIVPCHIFSKIITMLQLLTIYGVIVITIL